MRIILIITALLLPLPLLADPHAPKIDYAALFELHAERVTDTENEGVRELEMPGGVVLTQINNGDNIYYSGRDTSGDAVGCLADMLIMFKTMGMECPNAMSEAQRAGLDGVLERVLRYYAQNTYPPVSYEEVNSYVEAGMQEWIDGPWANKTCEGGQTYLHDLLDIYDPEGNGMLLQNFEPVLDEGLAVPRLPVRSPCL